MVLHKYQRQPGRNSNALSFFFGAQFCVYPLEAEKRLRSCFYCAFWEIKHSNSSLFGFETRLPRKRGGGGHKKESGSKTLESLVPIATMRAI
jgi:hypothetical protein